MKAFTSRGRAFDPAELCREYRRLHPQIVADLASACFAHETVFVADSERQTCVNIGRQQVWLYINSFLGLDPSQVEDLVAGRGYRLSTGDEDEN